MNSRETHLLQEFERMHGLFSDWKGGRELWGKRLLRMQQWLEEARALAPEIADWIGIYLKESTVREHSGTDLILGPFIGAETEHVRIPIDRGICGLALREERLVNVRDVRADSRHIACSLSTRSELVIPLADRSGKFVAELDIDSNKLDAFTESLERVFREKCGFFAEVWVPKS